MKPFSFTFLLFLILSGEINTYKMSSNVKPLSTSTNQQSNRRMEYPSSSAISTMGVEEDDILKKDDDVTTNAAMKPATVETPVVGWALPTDIPDDVVFAEFQRRFGGSLPESLAEKLAQMKLSVIKKPTMKSMPISDPLLEIADFDEVHDSDNSVFLDEERIHQGTGASSVDGQVKQSEFSTHVASQPPTAEDPAEVACPSLKGKQQCNAHSNSNPMGIIHGKYTFFYAEHSVDIDPYTCRTFCITERARLNAEGLTCCESSWDGDPDEGGCYFYYAFAETENLTKSEYSYTEFYRAAVFPANCRSSRT